MSTVEGRGKAVVVVWGRERTDAWAVIYVAHLVVDRGTNIAQTRGSTMLVLTGGGILVEI